jgi:hypothetical protein
VSLFCLFNNALQVKNLRRVELYETKIMNCDSREKGYANMSWRVLSSGIYRHVVRWKSTDVSEEHISSIFRVKE